MNNSIKTSCSVNDSLLIEINLDRLLQISEVGITLILCVAVYLSLINKKMPPTSESFPLVSQFYGCIIVEITVAMVCSCYCLHIYDPEGLRLLHFPNYLRVSALMKGPIFASNCTLVKKRNCKFAVNLNSKNELKISVL